MNKHYITRSGLFKGLLSLALASSPSLLAQDDDSEEVFELSPFSVDSSQDQGYQTTNTLSGNRMNTENRFVGASVTEITQQFLEDMNINNFEDVLDFVPNSSPATSGGVGDDPNGNEAIWGVRYKVRGFKLTGFSRDFFKTRIAPDNYNTNRMSFSRGPNSVLFGIAEPGGVTNAVSTRAAFTNSNRFGVRFDTWDSERYEVSLNRELIEDKLAIRVSALSNDHRNHRNPWHNKSDRYYGAITFKPHENTTLRAHYEWGNLERINVRSWAAGDAVSLWQEAGSQAIPDEFVNIPGRATGPQRVALLADYGMAEIRPQAYYPVITSGAVDERMFYNIGREMTSARNIIPGLAGNANSAISFKDDSIIPRTANVLGSGNKNKQEFSSTSLFWEQKLAENLFFEVAYNRQDTDNDPDFATGRWDLIFKDLLPTIRLVDPENPRTRMTGPGSTVPNPNFGKYYLFNQAVTTFQHTYDDETMRAMVSYELDLRDRFDGQLGTILGRHNLAALYETYDTSFVNRHFVLKNGIDIAGRRPGQSQNLALQNYIDVEKGLYDSDYIASEFPRVYYENREDIPGVNSTGVAPFWMANRNATSNTITETASHMFAMQNYFWENKIVTTFGWRTDDVDKWTLSRLPPEPVTFLSYDYGLMNPKTDAENTPVNGSTNTAGIVVTPIPWLGFFYNESSNFRPANPGELNIWGDDLGNEAGEGKDYGLKLYLMDGKVTGSLALFETDFQGQSTRGPLVGPVGQFAQPMTNSRNSIREYYEDIAMTPDLADKYFEYGYYNNAFFATQDLSAEGYEFSLTANPTKNWRVMFNMSKQENVATNVGPQMKAWAKHIRTVMNDPAQSDPILLTLPVALTMPDGVTNYTVADMLDLSDQRILEISSLEGVADQRQPEESMNLTTAYDFKEGRLKGFTLGGSVRWRGEAAIGYQLLGDGPELDATSPYWNKSTEWVGAFVSYRMKLPNDIGMRLQLNIDNLFDDEFQNPLVAREVNGQQAINRWLLPEGRSFALSATFDF